MCNQPSHTPMVTKGLVCRVEHAGTAAVLAHVTPKRGCAMVPPVGTLSLFFRALHCVKIKLQSGSSHYTIDNMHEREIWLSNTTMSLLFFGQFKNSNFFQDQRRFRENRLTFLSILTILKRIRVPKISLKILYLLDRV